MLGTAAGEPQAFHGTDPFLTSQFRREVPKTMKLQRNDGPFQVGDLILQYTDRFRSLGRSPMLEGSVTMSPRAGEGLIAGFYNGRHIAFWHPIPPKGFHALGTVALISPSSPDRFYRALCVAAANPENRPLLIPKDYVTESCGRSPISCRRAVCPDGYAALGQVFAERANMAASANIVCVRKDLLVEGRYGPLVFSDFRTADEGIPSIYWDTVQDNYWDMHFQQVLPPSDSGGDGLLPVLHPIMPIMEYQAPGPVFALRLPVPTVGGA